MRRPVAVLVGLAVLVAGGVAVVTSPYGDTLHDPIPVRGSVGHVVHSRVFDVTVDRARLGHALYLPDAARFDTPAPTITSTALWVVVDVDLTVNLDQSSLSSVELRAGGRTFQVDSTLPGSQLSAGVTHTGLPVTGSFAFEVPESLARGDVELWVKPRIDPVDDTVAVIPLKLAGMTVHDSLTVHDAALKDFR